MKKYLSYVLVIISLCSVFAQKKELRTAAKELTKGNFEKANISLDAAENLITSMSEKQKGDFYLLKSKFYYRDGKFSLENLDKAIENFLKISSVSDPKAKEFHYFELLNQITTQSNNYFNNQKFSNASSSIYKAYEISNDPYYLYVSASWSVQAKDYEKSLLMYEKLKTLKYTGIEKQFFATNKSTNVIEQFNNKIMRDASVKSKTHTNPLDKETKSKYPEIIKNIALIYNQMGETEKALKAITEARAENPNDLDLIINEANVYFEMGNMEKFKNLLEDATKLDPNNAELQYNLGYLSAEVKDYKAATMYYERAIEINPEYVDAYINLAVMILTPEVEINNQMNELINCTRSSCYDRYDELKLEKKKLYSKAIPYIEKALQVDSSNVQVLNKMSQMLSALDRVKEAKKYRELAKSLEN